MSKSTRGLAFVAGVLFLILLAVAFFKEPTRSGRRVVPEISLVSDVAVSFPDEAGIGRINAAVVDATGDVWILSKALRSLYCIREESEPVETVPLPEGKWRPTRLARDTAGNLFVADRDHILCYRRPEGKWTVWAWPGFSDFERIGALTCDATGDLYVADSSLGRIAVLSENGRKTRTIAQGDDVPKLGSLAVAPEGQIVCGTRRKVQIRSRNGIVLHEWALGSRLASSKGQPRLTVDQEGFIYVTNPDVPVFEVYDLEGNRLHVWKHSAARGTRLLGQVGIDVSPRGTLIVAHSEEHLAQFRVEWKSEHEVFPRLAARKRGPNLLLVTLDTTRSDHLGCYGYDRDTSPMLDEIAARGIRFTNAICQAPDTCASHASMLTSLHPFVHRARNLGFYLREEFISLAEVLRAAGYRTAAFLSGFTLTSYTTWLDQGFEVYDNFDSIHAGNETCEYGYRRADVTTDLAIQWLQRHQGERVFLWVHYFDPHTTYDPPEPYRSMFTYDQSAPALREERKVYWGSFPWGDLVAWYDGELRFMDTEIGRLMKSLENLGFAADLFAVFVGDHGELLGEHNVWCAHGNTLYDQEIRIPFIVLDTKPKRIKQPQVRSEPVETIDILPTFLDVAGLKIPEQAQGVSLLRWLRGEEREWPRPFTWTQVCKQAAGDPSNYTAVRTREWKHCGHTLRKGHRLYHLLSDPEESDDLSTDVEQVIELLGNGEGYFPDKVRADPGKMVLYSIAPGLEQLDDLHELPKEEIHDRFLEIYSEVTGWSAGDLLIREAGGEVTPDEEQAGQLRALGYLGD